MFNKELFYALCNKYGVELSDQYDKPMLKTDGGVRELVEQDEISFHDTRRQFLIRIAVMLIRLRPVICIFHRIL